MLWGISDCMPTSGTTNKYEQNSSYDKEEVQIKIRPESIKYIANMYIYSKSYNFITTPTKK